MYGRLATRFGVAVTVASAVTLAVTGVAAFAHVEVSADKAQAGATNVTLTFKGEAESTKAGIVSERVVLPEGITFEQVRLGTAPAGWTLNPSELGFTVAGPALAPRADAEFSVVIEKLPSNATELAFKTIETYSDGKVSSWIEIPKPGQAEPENPAPVLKLAAAEIVAPTTPAASPTSEASTSAPSQTPAANTTAEDPDDGSGTLWIVLVVVVVVVVAAAAAGTFFVLRRRRGTPPSP